MKTNWQTKKLGEICEITTGSSNTIDAVDDGQYAFFDRSKTVKKSNHFLFNGEALIIPGEGAEFFPKYYLGKFNLHQRAYALLNFHKEVEIKFIEYYLIFEHKYFERVAVGATVKSLRRRHFMDLEIPLPPLSEQKRIVKILDEAFEKIGKAGENAEKNLQNSKELFESYLQNVFANSGKDWEKNKLVNVFQIKPPKKEAKEKLKDNDLVSFVPMEDMKIMSKEFICNKERKLKEVSGSYTYFANEDVLLAKITPCFENGKLGIARNLKNGIGFGSSEYIVFRSNGKVIPDYLYYFLVREQFLKEGAKRMSGAVGHKRVSKEFIEENILPFPKSLAEQKIIVKKLDSLFEQTKKLKEVYRQKLADLRELKKSVLKKAFSGEL